MAKWRIALTRVFVVSSLLLSGATMSQQSSLTQSAHSVRQVLTAYTLWYHSAANAARNAICLLLPLPLTSVAQVAGNKQS